MNANEREWISNRRERKEHRIGPDSLTTDFTDSTDGNSLTEGTKRGKLSSNADVGTAEVRLGFLW